MDAQPNSAANRFLHHMTEVPYTHGYYAAMSPAVIAAALENAGQAAPDLSAPLNCFELGAGYGVTLAAHAACFPHMRFFGNDFNPEHVRFARSLADEAGLDNIEFTTNDFDDVLNRPLPPLDIIMMHGVYSWVSPRLRQTLCRFIAKRLKPGGVVYVSHNTLPGWAPLMPLRELMRLHAWHLAPGRLSLAEHLGKALVCTELMRSRGAGCFAGNPAAASELAVLAERDPRYVAHEYFNPEWHPQYVHEVAAEMAKAGLGRAASAVLEEHVDAAHLTAEARAHLATVTEPVLRETLRDYYLNQNFRRDLYVRGARVLPPAEHAARRLAQRWVATSSREDIAAHALEGPGTVLMDAAGCAALIEALVQPRSLAELLSVPALRPLGRDAVLAGLLMLHGLGHVQPALPPALRDAARDAVARFNAVVIERAASDGLHHLACSVTGQATGWGRRTLQHLRAHGGGWHIDEPQVERLYSRDLPLLRRLGAL